MELGNVCFGHGQGGYPVDREKWQAIFEGLWSALYGEDWGYIEAFDNDVFTVRSYAWDAACTCGLDARREAWWEAHSHAETCWIKENDRIEDLHNHELLVWGWRTGWTGLDHCGIASHPGYRDQQAKQDADLLRRAKVAGWPRDDNLGIACWCNCGVHAAEEAEFGDAHHTESCEMIQPNFLHKATGYAIEWYKYPFRDAYANQGLDAGRVRALVAQCVESLEEK